MSAFSTVWAQRRHHLGLTRGAVGGGLWKTTDAGENWAPVTDGQPATVSAVYSPPLMLLVWVLAVAAGVLAVLGVLGKLVAGFGGELGAGARPEPRAGHVGSP